MTEICNECGHSVKAGSGLFVDRVPDGNDVETRKDNGKPYPEGDYLCRECDAEDDGENVPCKKCGRTDLPLHYNMLCPDCFEV